MTWEDRLKARAVELFGSLGAFADAIRYHPVSVSNILNRKQSPKSDFFERCRQAGISLDWVFTGEGDPDADKPDPTGPEKRSAELLREFAADLEALHRKWTDREKNVDNSPDER